MRLPAVVMSRCVRPAGLAAVCLAMACGLWQAAQAQVVRCTDPASGKVSYTNGECGPGQSRKEIAPRPSDEELARHEALAQEAEKARRERQQAEAEAEAAREAALQPAPAPHPADSVQCAKARDALQDALARDASLYDTGARIEAAQQSMDMACLTPAEYARLRERQADRPVYLAPGHAPLFNAAPPHRPFVPHKARPRPEMVRCDVFRCYDKQGKTYPR